MSPRRRCSREKLVRSPARATISPSTMDPSVSWAARASAISGKVPVISAGCATSAGSARHRRRRGSARRRACARRSRPGRSASWWRRECGSTQSIAASLPAFAAIGYPLCRLAEAIQGGAGRQPGRDGASACRTTGVLRGREPVAHSAHGKPLRVQPRVLHLGPLQRGGDGCRAAGAHPVRARPPICA